MEFCVSNIRKIAIIWDFFVILIKKVGLQSGVVSAFLHRIKLCQQEMVIAQRSAQGSAMAELMIKVTAQLRYAV